MTAGEKREHDVELVSPLYGAKGAYTAFCVCGWASEELPTAGVATIAGWQHIHESKTERKATA